ncbi:MAG: methylmalonyl-CoA mutase family protein [Bacteroidota bacterium]
MTPPDKKLFQDFEPISKAKWLAKVQQDLKGKPIQKLQWKPEPGLDFAPFYTAEDLAPISEHINQAVGEAPFRRGGVFKRDGASWQAVQEVYTHDPAATERIAEAREAELAAFSLVGNALDASLMAAIDLSQNALHLSLAEKPILTAAELLLQAASQGVSKKLLTGTLRNDPLGAAAANDQLPDASDWIDAEGGLKNLSELPWFRALGLDMGYVQEQGGSITQELAFALATVVEYLDWLGKKGHDLASLLQNMALTFAVGNNFYLETAKLRAFRILFHKAVAAFGIEDESLLSPFVLSRTTRWSQTQYDVSNNLLRATTQSISSIMGGTDALIIRDYDLSVAAPSRRSNRLARNIHHLLAHESYLDQVLDPAGGSYFFEELTEQLAREAWQLFQEIEAAGGFYVALKTGFVRKQIDAYRSLQQEFIAKGKQGIVGVNRYADPSETLEQTNQLSSAAASFEQLRSRVDKWSRQNGAKPKVLLCSFGDVKMRNARLQFARNLLASAGFEFQETKPETLSDHSVADFVAFCAADTDYFQNGDTLVAQARSQFPKAQILIAGRPDGIEQLKADHYLYAGMPLLAFLEEICLPFTS